MKESLGTGDWASLPEQKLLFQPAVEDLFQRNNLGWQNYTDKQLLVSAGFNQEQLVVYY